MLSKHFAENTFDYKNNVLTAGVVYTSLKGAGNLNTINPSTHSSYLYLLCVTCPEWRQLAFESCVFTPCLSVCVCVCVCSRCPAQSQRWPLLHSWRKRWQCEPKDHTHWHRHWPVHLKSWLGDKQQRQGLPPVEILKTKDELTSSRIVLVLFLWSRSSFFLQTVLFQFHGTHWRDREDSRT